LADRSIVKPEGIVDDVIVSVDSWEYPANFMILQPKANLGGYPLILGWPWLATNYAYISCRSRDMTISHGTSTKKLTLYPPAKPSLDSETPSWIPNSDDEAIQPLLSLEQASRDTEDDLICEFLTYS
jgi:hypothetical protein